VSGHGFSRAEKDRKDKGFHNLRKNSTKGLCNKGTALAGPQIQKNTEGGRGFNPRIKANIMKVGFSPGGMALFQTDPILR
jgi:hypothetical protein